MKTFKNLIGVLLVGLLFMTSCQREEPPAPAAPPQTSAVSTCNPEETSLLGKWFLKRSEMYVNDTLNPSTVVDWTTVSGHESMYFRFDSILDTSNGIQATWPGAKHAINSLTGFAQNNTWLVDSGSCRISMPAASPTYQIIYIVTDSLILGANYSADSSQYQMYYFHK